MFLGCCLLLGLSPRDAAGLHASSWRSCEAELERSGASWEEVKVGL